MTTQLVRPHTWVLVPLAAVAVALAFAPMGQGSAEAGALAQKRVIGTAVSNGFRVKVTAVRTTGDMATVKVAAFERVRGAWDRLGRPRVVGQRSGWFWNVVTRPFGVRSLTLSRPGGRFPARIALKLLVSPSIGPSGTFRFVVDRGRLVAVDV